MPDFLVMFRWWHSLCWLQISPKIYSDSELERLCYVVVVVSVPHLSCVEGFWFGTYIIEGSDSLTVRFVRWFYLLQLSHFSHFY